MNLEHKIKQLSEDIFATKTKQKRIRKFDKYLKEWGISRLTTSKRKEISTLLKNNQHLK